MSATLLEGIGRTGRDEQAAAARVKVLVPVVHFRSSCFKTLVDGFESFGDKVEQGDVAHALVTR
jgi:hypothetical protein